MQLGKVTATKETLEALGLDGGGNDDEMLSPSEVLEMFDKAWTVAAKHKISIRLQKFINKNLGNTTFLADAIGLVQTAHIQLVKQMVQNGEDPKKALKIASGQMLDVVNVVSEVMESETDGHMIVKSGNGRSRKIKF